MRPEIMRRLAVEVLERELDHELRLNAATGYQIEPSWPAPEVFERPEWSFHICPPGEYQAEIAEMDGPMLSTARPGGGDSEHVPVQTTTIRPAVTIRVSEVGERDDEGPLWGLGFHVASRTLWLFQPPDGEGVGA